MMPVYQLVTRTNLQDISFMRLKITDNFTKCIFAKKVLNKLLTLEFRMCIRIGIHQKEELGRDVDNEDDEVTRMNFV